MPFEPDGFQADSFQPDSFTPDKPVDLPKGAPQSVMAVPSSQQPISTSVPAPQLANEPPRQTAIVSPSAQTVTTYTPNEQDVTDILSKVRPEEREVARQVMQRDVKTREDLNILQGKLTDFGHKHGFGVSAGFVEDALNPMSVAEWNLFEAGAGLSKDIIRKFIRGKVAGPTFNEVEKALQTEMPIAPDEVMTRQELFKKKTAIMEQLALPDEIGRATPNDPMGMNPKRLALPGESGGEIVEAPRMSQNDPMGVLGGKKYQVLPADTPIPDALIKDVTPEGLRDIVLHQEVAAQQAAKMASERAGTSPVKIAGKTKSEVSQQKTADMVRGLIDSGGDLALAAEARTAIQVEREVFQDPSRVVENLKQSPLNSYERGWKWFSGFWNSARDMVKGAGPVGEQVAKREAEAVTVADVRAGAVNKVLNQILPTIENNKIWQDNLVDVLEGKEQPVNDYVKRAAISVRAMMDQVGSEAQHAGLKIFRTKEGIYADWVPRQNYYPRFYDLQSMMGKNGADVREKIIQQVMDSKKIDRSAALRIIDDFTADSMRRFGPLETGRTADLPGYSRNVREVLNSYFGGAFHRLELAKQLGPNNEIAASMINAVEDPYLRKILDAGLQTMTGRTTSGAIANLAREDVSKGLQLLSKSLMPLSAIQNSFQGVYGSLVKTNSESTLRAFIKSFTGAGKADAQEAGALLNKFSNLFDEHVKGGNFFDKNGFSATEGFNRTVQALAQKNYMEGKLTRILAKDPNNPYLARELGRLGLDAERVISRGKFTEDEIKKGMVRAVEMTQGRFDTASMPILSSTPLGKVLYHLRSFDLLWWKYAKDYTIAEAKAGNFVPAIKLITGGAAVGEIQSSFWQMISGREKPEEPIERVMNNLSFASSLGIMTDILNSMVTGKKKGVANFFLNPSEQVAQDLLNAGVDMRAGKFSGVTNLVGKRVAVPAAVSVAGKFGPVAGLAAGTATRAGVDRIVKVLKEKESE